MKNAIFLFLMSGCQLIQATLNSKIYWKYQRKDIEYIQQYYVHNLIVGGWHSKLGGGALADAILDRIVPKYTYNKDTR